MDPEKKIESGGRLDSPGGARPIIELILLFFTFFLPGILWPEAGLALQQAGLTSYMLRFLWIAIPQTLLLLYVIDRSGGPPLAEFGVRPISWRDLPRAFLVYTGIFAVLMGVNLTSYLLPDSRDRLLGEGFRWSLERPSQVPLALLFSLATGYREELFFRSYLITRFTRFGLPAFPAILLSTLLFASGHLYQGAAGLIVATAQGLYFGLVFTRSRNLHILALAHALYNLTVLLLTLWRNSVLPGAATSAILAN